MSRTHYCFSRLLTVTVVLLLVYTLFSKISCKFLYIRLRAVYAAFVTTSFEKGLSNDVYVMNAYLISNTELRITMLGKCHYYPVVTAYVDGSGGAETTVYIENLQRCPPGYLPRCFFTGKYGMLEVAADVAADLISGRRNLHLAIEDRRRSQNWKMKRVQVIDSRPTNQPKHRLAVCVAPAVLMAHWPSLPFFFESWISQGATKFFFYYQSMSKEFEAMLRIYEGDRRRTDVERIAWSEVESKDEGERNINDQMVRAEQALAINDCLLRARGRARFVAVSDYDEIFVARRGWKLLELLDHTLQHSPSIASILFRHSFFTIEGNWSTLTHPSQLTFDFFSTVSLDKVILSPGVRSKAISIPERTRMASIHEVFEAEPGMRKYQTVPPEEGLLYHLRFLPADFKSTPDTALGDFVKTWNEQYRERLENELRRLSSEDHEGLTLRDAVWRNDGLEVMAEHDKCYYAKYDLRYKGVCPAQHSCIDEIGLMKRSDWIFANQSWVRL